VDTFIRASELPREGREYLIEEIRPGTATLVYGQVELLEKALYRLVSAWASSGERSLIVSFVDYHESQVIDTYTLAEYMLSENMDPEAGLKLVYLATLYNKRQAVSLDYKRVLDHVRPGVVALYRVSRLFKHAEYPLLLSALSRAREVMMRGLPLVVFVDESQSRRGLPEGPAYLLHFSSTVIRLKGLRGGYIEASLVKSPWRRERSEFFESNIRAVEGWF
jgi:hypothetical protein